MPKILIVDDAAFIRFTLRQMLEKNGFEIAGEAENGEIALTRYMELKPDVVTMDITMPVKTGIEAVSDIIAFDSKAKIVMVSALGQETYIIDAIKRGAKSFIVKPFKEDHVLDVLRKLSND